MKAKAHQRESILREQLPNVREMLAARAERDGLAVESLAAVVANSTDQEIGRKFVRTFRAGLGKATDGPQAPRGPALLIYCAVLAKVDLIEIAHSIGIPRPMIEETPAGQVAVLVVHRGSTVFHIDAREGSS